jgi:sugar lactone lactonase YvrE
LTVLCAALIGSAARLTAVAQTPPQSPPPVAWEANGLQPAGGKVLVRGAPIRGAEGIAFARHGRLFIASSLGREILVMNPATGRILDRLGLPDIDVGDPDDLIFGPDGSLYWTSALMGEVLRLSPDRIKKTLFVGPGVNSITFSDDGRLFVSQCFLGQTLFKLDPSLSQRPRFIRDDLGPGRGLNGMDRHDGFLYGPRWYAGEVVRVNVDSGAVSTVADGFGTPSAVKFDSRGRMHILDARRGEVVRVDTATGHGRIIARLQAGLDNLAFDSRDRLLVSNFVDGSITQILSGGVRVVRSGGMIAPGGVTVLTGPLGRETVLVADSSSVREFDGRRGKPGSVTTGFFWLCSRSPRDPSPDDGFV